MILTYFTRAGAQHGYEWTPKDRLWLLRAVAAEGPDYNEVAQTLVNRFLYLRAMGNTAYPTLADLVIAYAQPLSPKWRDKGDEKTRERRKKARERTKFKREQVRAVDRALKGSKDIPPRSIHYAAPWVKRKTLQPLTKRQEGRNRLWATKNNAWWSGYTSAGGGGGGAGLIIAVGALMLAMGADDR